MVVGLHVLSVLIKKKKQVYYTFGANISLVELLGYALVFDRIWH